MQIDVQTPCEGWCRIIDPILILLSDTTIAIQILIADAAKSGAFLYSMIVDLFLTLEDTVVDVTYLREHRMANNAFHTIATILTVGGYSLRQFGNLVDIFADVSTDIP